MERLEGGAAIAEGPKGSCCGGELIAGVGELPQLRAVDTGQPEQSGGTGGEGEQWGPRAHLSVSIRLHSVTERLMSWGAQESRAPSPGSRLPLNGTWCNESVHNDPRQTSVWQCRRSAPHLDLPFQASDLQHTSHQLRTGCVCVVDHGGRWSE